MTLNKKTGGFTLVEIMISSAIGCIFCAAAAWFLVEGTRISLKTAAASENDLAQWGIFSAMSIDSKIANGMVMYPDFNLATVTDPKKQLNDQNVGNVLILTKFHFESREKVNGTKKTVSKTAIYDQLTGYVFDSTYGTLKKFTYQTSDDEQKAADSVETILGHCHDSLTLSTISANLTASSFGASGKAFLCRSKNNRSAVLTVEILSGTGHKAVDKRKLIEATLHVRG